MNEESVRRRSRRRSRAEAEQLVAEYEASGLGRQEFCEKHGLALGTLDRYRKWQRQGNAGGGSRWVAVELSGAKTAGESGAGSELAVVLTRGRRIEVRRGFDGNTLEQLVRLLEQV
jgi:transposase-like protein